MKKTAVIIRTIIFLIFFGGIILGFRNPVYALTADLEGQQVSSEAKLYRVTKGSTETLNVLLPSKSIAYTAEDGTEGTVEVQPEITKWTSSKTDVLTVEDGVAYALSEGSTTIKVSYQYVVGKSKIKESAYLKIRVVAYRQTGTTITFVPEVLDQADITYSMKDACAQARDNATEEAPYTIRIPQGNYTLTETLHLYSNITLDMDANAVITTTAPTGNNIFLLGTNSEYMGQSNYNESALCAGYGGFQNITIKGGTLVGNSSSTSCLIRMAHATNVRLEGVTFTGGGGSHQVEVAAIDGFTVKNCVFQDFYGLKGVTGNYEALQLDIPCAKSPYVGTYEDGTVLKNVEITGCVFKNLSKGIGTHTMLVGAYHRNIKINNNTFSNITNEAIICLNYYECEIKDNVMKDCGAGIEFQYYLPNRYCIYNTIFEGTQEYTGSLRHNAKCVISGNKMTIKYHTGYVGCVGIDVYGYNRTETITGAAYNKVKAQNYYVSGVTITDNEIVTAGYGIRLSDAKKCTITNNTVTGKDFSVNDAHYKAGRTYDGIYVTNASTVSDLSGNVIRNMNGGGIYLESSTATNGIKNNTITGVKRYGIYVYYGGKTKGGISGNTIKSTKTAEALIYINTTAKTRQVISGNTLKGCKTNSAVKIGTGVFSIYDNTISRVASGVVAAEDTAKGYIYANTYSSKAASAIYIGEKLYRMAEPASVRKKATKKGITVEFPAIRKAEGYEVWISDSKDFTKNLQIKTYSAKKTQAVLSGLEKGKKYYIRVYGYVTYKGIRIYRKAQ